MLLPVSWGNKVSGQPSLTGTGACYSVSNHRWSQYWRHVYEGFALAISIGVCAFHYVCRDHAAGTSAGASTRRGTGRTGWRRGTRRTTTAGGAFVTRGGERGSADRNHAQ